jgi:hypothetical protein
MTFDHTADEDMLPANHLEPDMPGGPLAPLSWTTGYVPSRGLYLTFPGRTVLVPQKQLDTMSALRLSQYVAELRAYYEA